jgi:hypothetical protein
MVFSFIHDGKIYLENEVEIIIVLIAKITGLPQSGEDLGALFTKVGERTLLEAMKEKFITVRGKRGLDFQHINNKKVWFATQYWHEIHCANVTEMKYWP